MALRAVSAYSLVHATVRALYSRLVTPETWETLLQAEDFEDTLTTLSKTAYAPYLEEVERERMTPRRAVYQIRQRLTDVYEKVIRLAPQRAHDLLVWLWRLYEVDDIKATLRGIEAGATWDRVRFLLYPRHEFSLLSIDDLEAMVRTGSVTRAIEILRGTPYYDTLAHAINRYQAERTLFPLEVALDLDYNRRLWQSLNRLPNWEREHALRTLGSVLDMDNLLWAIRHRVYHNLSQQEIINYTLPFGYQVQDGDIRAIAAGRDIARVIKRVYPDLADLDILTRLEPEDGAPLETLEVILQRRIVKLCHKEFIGDPFHVGIPVAYLLLNEYENRDLILIIEAKASRFPRRKFDSLLLIQPAITSPA